MSVDRTVASIDKPIVDPITLEVVRNRLDVIAQEMQSTLLRSAYSSIIKEGLDASAALFNADGELVAQANALPVHLGSMGPVVTRILQVYPVSTMRDGDAFIMNDPYEGGQHLPDIVLVFPIFASGTVVALSCTMAHHQDVGGKVPGSLPQDATEIYQEGLIIPPLKLYDQGRVNETFMAILRKNVRIPDIVSGDLSAQVAAGQTGRRQVLELVASYGAETVVACMQALLDQSEALTRSRVAEIPDGVYTFQDYLDNDGIHLDALVTLKATVTVSGSDLTVDFAGSAPQLKGPFNAVPSVALSAASYAVRVITDPAIPNNGGCYRMLTLKLPPRSVVNPESPAPVNSRAVTLRRMVEAILGALVKAVPHKLTAANNGHPLMMSIGGYDPRTDRRYVTSVVGTGGMGARPTKDGIDSIQTDTSNAMNIPVEAVETYYPIRINRFSLRNDSGGPGQFRGGLGFEYSFTLMEGDAWISHRGERHRTSPWGLFGGGPGVRCRTEVIRASGSVEVIPSKADFPLSSGDRVDIYTTGGGGYGDPLLRDTRQVLEDVLRRRVSREQAYKEYGVVLDENGAVNEQATANHRARVKQTRGAINWTFDRGPGLGRE